MSYDPRVVSRIRQIAADRGEPMRYVIGAMATGIVESGLQDLEGGDADSYGFRQQRESIYGRQDLDTQINNLFNEFHQYDKGQGIGELVADVQRPAAQYRGRYAQVLGQAEKLAGGKDTGGQSTEGDGAGAVDTPQRVSAPNPFTTIAALSSNQQSPYSDTLQRGWDLLGRIWEQKYGGQQSATPSLGQVTQMGNTAQGQGGQGGLGGLREAFFDPEGGYKNGQSIGAIGGHGDHAHFGGGPKTLARIVALAQSPQWKSGLTVREYAPVDPVDPVHVAGSWHDRFGGKGAADISGPKMDAFFKEIIRRAGWKR